MHKAIFLIFHKEIRVSLYVYISSGHFLKETLKTGLKEKVDIFSAIKLKYLNSSKQEKIRSAQREHNCRIFNLYGTNIKTNQDFLQESNQELKGRSIYKPHVCPTSYSNPNRLTHTGKHIKANRMSLTFCRCHSHLILDAAPTLDQDKNHGIFMLHAEPVALKQSLLFP